MKKITVLFFANLKEKAGTKRFSLEIADTTRVSDLKGQLRTIFPAINDALGSVLVAINQDFAFDEDVIPADAEVGLFPPVSGGSGPKILVNIVYDTLDLNRLVADITSNSTGAACIFSGIVRGETRRGNPHETTSLEYEAYTPMALAKMTQIAKEIVMKWPDIEGISMVQRIGRLEPMTPTVAIACTAAHRDTGVFDAAHYGIDRLKEIVPIWKKEIGPAGETWIEGDYMPTRED